MIHTREKCKSSNEGVKLLLYYELIRMGPYAPHDAFDPRIALTTMTFAKNIYFEHMTENATLLFIDVDGAIIKIRILHRHLGGSHGLCANNEAFRID